MSEIDKVFFSRIFDALFDGDDAYINSVFENLDIEHLGTANLLTPLALCCTVQSRFPSYADAYERIKSELIRRGRTDIDSLLAGLEPRPDDPSKPLEILKGFMGK